MTLRRTVLEVGGLVAIAALMLVSTWGRWPDPQVDFGGELYVAWRIAEGEVLYRDLAYFTGPLSPYLNGLWFALFGTSLRTLVAANLAILFAIALLLHRLIDRIAGRLVARDGLAVFLTLFAFAQLTPVGNSNYVTPYAHETTHGALLALAALNALERWLATRRTLWIALSGCAVGLAFLTKVEVFLAVGAAAGTGIALALWLRRERVLGSIGTFALAAVLPVILAFAMLASAIGPRDALQGTLGAWPYLTDERITGLPFYAWILGTDDPASNLATMFAVAGRCALVCGAALALGFAARAGSRARWMPLLAFALGLGGTLALRIDGRTWMEVARPWPLFVALALCVLVADFLRARRAPSQAENVAVQRSILRIAFAVWAFVLLAKMILNARIQMYGFALAMPATMLVVAALVGWLPEWIERRGGSARVARGAALGVVAAAVFGHLQVMQSFVQRITVPIGRGADAFRADVRARLLGAALEEIERRTAPDARIVVLPEGVMLNYLARRVTGVRYINYMPPELLMFGEERIIADFEAHPPDAVVTVAKSTAEYGVPIFGRDYGKRLWNWVDARYAARFSRVDEQVMLAPGVPFSVKILEPKRSAGDPGK